MIKAIRKTFGYIDFASHLRATRESWSSSLDVHSHAWRRVGVLMGIEDILGGIDIHIDNVTGEVYAWVEEEVKADV